MVLTEIKKSCERCGGEFTITIRFPSDVKRSRSLCSKTCCFPVLGRLAEKTDFTSDGCWLYTGRKHGKSGHCKIGFNNKYEFIHRASWILFRSEIPNGKHVLHRCGGHPNCWNPFHLYLGTHVENNRDRDVQGRTNHPVGERNPKSRLTDDMVMEIRSRPKSVRLKQIASEFGVSVSTISSVRTGRTWKL